MTPEDKKLLADHIKAIAKILYNFSLINWVNSQNLARTVYCLGDGHDDVWNLFAQIADDQTRQEILDWYHLNKK